jgi:alkylated DNA nucleotide flippase Atl1
MVSDYRANVLATLAHVRPGEWAAYGDLAEAAGLGPASGHGRAVGEVFRAEYLGDRLPNVRALLASGYVPDGAPAWVLPKLADEGIRFEHDRADPAQRVTVAELRRRLDAAADESARLDDVLAALVETLIGGAFDVGDAMVRSVETFAELGILTADLGLVVRLSDGRAFALKLTEYRR